MSGRMWSRVAALLGVLALPAVTGAGGRLDGSFVQLTRAAAAWSAAEWSDALKQIKDAGLDTVIVQWCAVDGVAYLRTGRKQSETEESVAYPEQYDVLTPLFAAAREQGLSVWLGLHQDSTYWTQIKARDVVLRDYFLTRVARNERLQRELVARYGQETAWVGYYLPDEIDDLSWRAPGRRALIRDYLALSVQRIRVHDGARPVAVSAFFRGRTAPDLYAALLRDIVTTEPAVDRVLVQDGAGVLGSGGGVGDPPLAFAAEYYKVLRAGWPEQGPALELVLEAFEQTQADPFAARPAAPERLLKQHALAAPYFGSLTLFTLLDYADPRAGDAASALHAAVRELSSVTNMPPASVPVLAATNEPPVIVTSPVATNASPVMVPAPVATNEPPAAVTEPVATNVPPTVVPAPAVTNEPPVIVPVPVASPSPAPRVE